MGIRLGDEAPNFTADTTEGTIDFHDWKAGSWVVLFSHPADFTPVCTTELGRTAALNAEFAKRNTKTIAVSVDPRESHKGWAGDIGDVGGFDRVDLPGTCASCGERKDPVAGSDVDDHVAGADGGPDRCEVIERSPVVVEHPRLLGRVGPTARHRRCSRRCEGSRVEQLVDHGHRRHEIVVVTELPAQRGQDVTERRRPCGDQREDPVSVRTGVEFLADVEFDQYVATSIDSCADPGHEGEQLVVWRQGSVHLPTSAHLVPREEPRRPRAREYALVVQHRAEPNP